MSVVPTTVHRTDGQRRTALRQLKTAFDLIVVGGGANGTGIAWDAALRGLRVLLLEKEDFGWATSAWNSRLIHGGLKYLEKYDVPLVRDSLREREWMLYAAPHLVRARRFVLPFYRRNAHHHLTLRAGMFAYDVLSFDKTTPRHRTYGAVETASLFPGLDTEGLQGAATYYDGQVDYVERLSVEVAIAARAAGAVVLNHARVEKLLVRDGTVTGVEVVDEITGTKHLAYAETVVNATGPWVDELLSSVGSGPDAPLMGGTKGTHLVVDPFPGAPTDSVMYYEAVTDARPMMVIPWLGRYLLGATDVRFTGDLDLASLDDDELTYILRETNLAIPSAQLTPSDVLWSYTGVRPLPYSPAGPTSDISRRHVVHHHTADLVPVPGLLSVVGGKLTTFRSLAQDVTDDVLRKAAGGRLRRGRQRSTTATARLPGAQTRDYSAFSRRYRATSALPPEVADRLLSLYGTRAVAVEGLIGMEPDLGRPIEGVRGLTAAEVVFALRTEAAVTLTDLVARRIMTGVGGDLGRDSLVQVAEVAAAEAGWSDSRVAEEVSAYLTYIQKLNPRTRPPESRTATSAALD